MAGHEPPYEENSPRNRILIQRKEVPGSTDDELRWLWQAAGRYCCAEPNEGRQGHGRKHRGPFGPFIQMLILTGQRRNEVAKMTWDELDLEKRVWVIPDKRAKNGRPHWVPLSDAAFEVLQELPRINGKSGYVFTTDGVHPISGWGRMKHRVDNLMQEIAREECGAEVAIAHWTLHDLRRTLAAGMQRLSIQVAVTEKILNHTSGSFAGIVGVYQVHDYAEEKEAALQAWGRFVTGLIGGAPTNVVPIRSVA
jgi:integrase